MTLELRYTLVRSNYVRKLRCKMVIFKLRLFATKKCRKKYVVITEFVSWAVFVIKTNTWPILLLFCMNVCLKSLLEMWYNKEDLREHIISVDHNIHNF